MHEWRERTSGVHLGSPWESRELEEFFYFLMVLYLNRLNYYNQYFYANIKEVLNKAFNLEFPLAFPFIVQPNLYYQQQFKQPIKVFIYIQLLYINMYLSLPFQNPYFCPICLLTPHIILILHLDSPLHHILSHTILSTWNILPALFLTDTIVLLILKTRMSLVPFKKPCLHIQIGWYSPSLFPWWFCLVSIHHITLPCYELCTPLPDSLLFEGSNSIIFIFLYPRNTQCLLLGDA